MQTVHSSQIIISQTFEKYNILQGGYNLPWTTETQTFIKKDSEE